MFYLFFGLIQSYVSNCIPLNFVYPEGQPQSFIKSTFINYGSYISSKKSPCTICASSICTSFAFQDQFWTTMTQYYPLDCKILFPVLTTHPPSWSAQDLTFTLFSWMPEMSCPHSRFVLPCIQSWYYFVNTILSKVNYELIFCKHIRVLVVYVGYLT